MEKVRSNKILDEIDFNQRHLLFIQEYIKGTHLNTIKKILKIETDDEFQSIKQEVKNKLAVTNSLDIIKKTYELKLVTINGNLTNNWRDIAFKNAYNIYLFRHHDHIEENNLKLVYIKILRMYVTILR